MHFADVKVRAALAFAALDEMQRDPLADPRAIEAARGRFIEAGERIKSDGKTVRPSAEKDGGRR